MSDGASVDNASTSAPLLNFRDSGKASLPVAFSKPPDLDLAFRQRVCLETLAACAPGLPAFLVTSQPSRNERTNHHSYRPSRQEGLLRRRRSMRTVGP